MVTINGNPVPLFYANPGQINAQIPWETAVGAAAVVVSVNGAPSNTAAIHVSPAAPDILQYNGDRAVAIMPDGSYNGPTNPAAAGDYLVLYLTGIGAVDPAVPAGSASPSGPLAQASGARQLTLDGAAIPIAFLGLTPTYVGLAQMNLQVPSGIAPGDHTLVLTVAGVASNSVSISVK